MACVRGPLGTCYLYQGGDLDFVQRGRLREQTGEKFGYHTGGKTGRRIRGDWDIKQAVELRELSGYRLGHFTGGRPAKSTRPLVNPDRTSDGRDLALPDFQQGKFHFPTMIPSF